MRYLKRCYTDQLLINKAHVSRGSPHLKRLWLSSLDFLFFGGIFSILTRFSFLIFSDFLKFLLYFHMRHDMSKVVTWINPIIRKHVSLMDFVN